MDLYKLPRVPADVILAIRGVELRPSLDVLDDVERLLCALQEERARDR